MAEAGIPEYRVVHCNAEIVGVYRDPGAGGYRSVHRVAGRAVLALQAFPDVELTVADIFA
jgi:Uma2 family endonuclease